MNPFTDKILAKDYVKKEKRFTGVESNQSALLSLRNSSPESHRSVSRVTPTQTNTDSSLLVSVLYTSKESELKENCIPLINSTTNVLFHT